MLGFLLSIWHLKKLAASFPPTVAPNKRKPLPLSDMPSQPLGEISSLTQSPMGLGKALGLRLAVAANIALNVGRVQPAVTGAAALIVSEDRQH